MKSVGKLLSLVVVLEYTGTRPVHAANWYGRAIQKTFIDALTAVGYADFGDESHRESERRPYTVSSLNGLSNDDNGFLLPGRRFHLRLTSLNDAVFSALVRATEMGAPLGLGAELTMINQPFAIRGMTADQLPAAFQSYEEIWETRPASQEEQDSPIGLQIASPAYFKITDLERCYPLTFIGHESGLVCHMPLPALFFQSLFEKWNTFAPSGLHIDDEAITTFHRKVFPARMELQSESVKLTFTGKPPVFHIGCAGYVSYNAGKRSPPEVRRILEIMMNYALFAGVGHDTTFGFGQCGPAFCES